MHDPNEVHFTDLLLILHYLKDSPDKEILFKRKSSLVIETYTDADYA